MPPHAARFRRKSLSLSSLGLGLVWGVSSLLGAGCTQRPPKKNPPVFADSFERLEVGPNYRDTAPPGTYRIEAGALVVRGAHNHPLWLARELPRDAVIEVDAWSASPAGDIKVEAFGDGKSFATSVEYTSSGYVFIQGGWQNRLSALCRMDEHGHDRKTRQDLLVVPGKRYHWLIARHGNSVEWFVDGELALRFDDEAPLSGPAHSYFGFDDWEAELHFDNLVVRPY